MIADDNHGIRAALLVAIRSIDPSYELYEAEDGQGAIEKAEAVKPDLVILDLRMKRLDGLTAGRTIKRLLTNTTMLVFTFAPTEHIEAAAREAGFADVIDKTDSRRLIAAIRNALKPRTLAATATDESTRV